MAYIKYIIFLFSVIAYTGASLCSTNEHVVRCAQDISCQPTCAKRNIEQCPTVSCIRGCECDDGYVRVTNTEGSPCITIAQCQTQSKSSCGIDEDKVECGNPCQPSCIEPNRAPCPTFACTPGCACKNSYIRLSNSASSTCVPKGQCPSKASK